jgi:hypothetical protein
MKKKMLLSAFVVVSAVGSANAMALTEQLLSVTNHSQYAVAVGPATTTGRPIEVPAGSSISNRGFTHMLFVSRSSKSGLAKDSYPFIYDVTAVGQSLSLARQAPQMGKTCTLSPALSSMACSKGKLLKICRVAITFDKDNTVEFNDGIVSHKTTLQPSCH